MRDGCVVRGRAVQLPQGANRAPREGEPLRRRPRRVRLPFLDRRRGRVDDREEMHLAGVTGRVLKRIEDAGRPAVQLQPLQRLELSARFLPGVRVVARGKVVQVQQHAILTGGMNAGIDAVEPLLLRAPRLQVDVLREPAQPAVEGDYALRLQQAAQARHLRRAQRRRVRDVEPDGALPLLQRMHADAANAATGKRLHPGRFAGQQDRSADAAESRNGPAQRGADPAGLVRDLVGFVRHHVRVGVDPLRRPVLDFDDPDARRADGDEIDFVRLQPVVDRERQIRQEDPDVVAERRPEAAPDVLERLALAVVGERSARETSDVHCCCVVAERRKTPDSTRA